MGHKEQEIIKNRLLTLEENERLFRINAGMGWVGQTVKHTAGMIILKNPRPFHGAPVGWPDLCGFTEIEITPDMVGKKIAVFTGEEIKAGNDRMRTEQTGFQELILRMGGFYRVLK